MQIHDYEMINVTDGAKNPNKGPENAENENSCATAEIAQTATEQIVKETEEETQTTSRDNEEIDMNAESDWQKPISLKGFKKKLNEMFIVK